MGLDPTYPFMPIGYFTGFVSPIVPLPWMLRSYNIGACAFSVLAAIQSLDAFVRAVVWRDSIRNVAPWYCDISIRLQSICNIGIPICSFIINRRLYLITQYKADSRELKRLRRSIYLDLFLCVALPLLYLVLCYTVQDRRYLIQEQVGCLLVVTNNVLSLVIVNGLPIIPSLLSILYIPYIFRSIRKTGKEMAEVNYSGQLVSRSNYNRLLALSLFDLLITLPTNGAFLIVAVLDNRSQLSDSAADSPNWHKTHVDVSEILVVPAFLWRADRPAVIVVYYAFAANMLFSLAFFAFFGTTKEMRGRYEKFFRLCKHCFSSQKNEWKNEVEVKGEAMIFAPVLGSTTKDENNLHPSVGEEMRRTQAVDTTGREHCSFTNSAGEFEAVQEGSDRKSGSGDLKGSQLAICEIVDADSDDKSLSV